MQIDRETVARQEGRAAVSPKGDEGTDARLDEARFRALLQSLARAWTEQDTDAAVACFSGFTVYMEPPNEQLYVGTNQLRPYFAALKPGTFMIWHGVWFDEDSQTGVGEFTFGREGASQANHGVAVIEVRNGRIARWREYQRTGPPSFDQFISESGKKWAWTIENYP